jgi:hypothetical protein
MNMKFKVSILSLFALNGVLLSGCSNDKPEREFMPDMYESTSFKAQKEDRKFSIPTA